MEEGDNHRQRNQRNTALLLIFAGLFLILHKVLNFAIIAALVLIIFGVYRVRKLGDKSGYIIAGIGIIILVSNHFALALSIVLISLGLFYIKSKDISNNKSGFFQKHTLVTSVKHDKEPWVLRNMGWWSLVSEMNFDLSLAMPEQEETTIVLQGVLGDVDIMVPEDVGVRISASVLFGQLNVRQEKETGMLNKIEWQSPNYETSATKVQLFISYVVGDIDVKVL